MRRGPARSAPRRRSEAVLGLAIAVVVGLSGLPSVSAGSGRPTGPGSSVPVDRRGEAAGPAPTPHGLRVAGTSASPWVNRTGTFAGPSPSARSGAMIADDVASGYIVLFGGSPTPGGAPLRDTWIYQNGAWSNLTATLAVAPPARSNGMLAYDPIDRELVLYGGNRSGGLLGDTWAFSGGAWTELFPSSSPGPLADATMTYDAADGYLLLYGGENADGTALSATWAFSGGIWSNLTGSVAGAPPALIGAASTYDPSIAEVVLFGGSGPNGTSNATWTYSDLTWTNLTGLTGATPAARALAGLAYDAADGFDLLFGGTAGGGGLNDTWTFARERWTRLTPALAPPARSDAAMAYSTGPETAEASVVLFGGSGFVGPNATSLADTWTFKVPLAGNLTVAPAAIDKGESTTVSVGASGGFPPYTVSWPALPSGCAGPNRTGRFACAPAIPGAAVFVAEITDSVNATVLLGAVNVTVADDPTVSILASPTVGTAPLAVALAPTLSGGIAPYRYAWALGDGTNSTAVSPSVTYATPGNYSVNLTVTDATGATAIAEPVGIVAAGALTANATASVLSGPAPLTVAFAGEAAGGVAAYGYNWSFGPTGAFSDAPDPSYTFGAPGAYSVRLTVSDPLGDTANATLTVSVLVPLSASFTSTFANGACVDGSAAETLELAAVAQGGVAPYNESWTIAGVPAYGPAPEASVAAGAAVLVSLEVRDASGARVNTTAGLTAPAVACPTAAPPSGPPTATILWVLLGLLLLIVGVEAVVLWMGRRSDGA